ncbi:hypothetical protein DEU56DRAFT_891883 [Suillus clintonianus]|uniref:uncharacterized protein n=1 Tax=Suillus clintonianus TaxID=1904413 RepID=UPI001B88120C|nr:uncharacterized protein DEU56DRAFT_891883 [Suillus clintonianus]KAG2126530.1 hypothetical protein DEU56DRAFT_891883 [Suillus clintonianus]
MHRALLVSEVLLEIFVYLSQSPSTKVLVGCTESLTRKSLAALARTCKTFHEPAMDLLWANIHGLRPLLGCVPRLHPMIYDTGIKYSWSQRVGPLAEHEFHQFLHHSARVRNMSISEPNNNYFHLLTALPIETCLFPGLLSLSWIVQCTNTRILHFFLSPTLRRYCVSDLRVHSDMEYIGTSCAALEALTVLKDSDTAQLSETVRSCKRLKHLQCPPLDSGVWKHLSTIPTLLTVRIVASHIFRYPLDQNKLDFAPFVNLTSLSFHGGKVAAIITIIQHSEFPSLKEFAMHVRVLPWEEAEQLFRALSQCKACQTIEHISISSHDRIQEHSSNSMTAIRHFMCFTQLRTLRLSACCSMYLDNDLLLEAMSSWPHIRTLLFADRHPCPPTVTFRGLFAALSRCPHLQDLLMFIDARNIDIDPETESFQHTSLQSLRVGAFEEPDAEAVARIIFSKLPCINWVGCGGGHPQLWHDVNSRLKSLKKQSP